MGWGRTLLLGDIGTQLNVNDVESDVEQVKQHLEMQDDKNASQDQAVAQLQQDNHELKMFVATLLRLLVSKNVLTNEELNRFVDLLDPK
jgi:hypothetical protein